MHIAVEATPVPHDRRGIGRYMRSLLRTMPQVRPEVRYTLHVRPRDVPAMTAQLASIAGVAERAVVEPLTSLRDTLADVAWYPCNWIREPTARAPMAVSIHDLVPMLDEPWWKVLRRAKARARSIRTVALASRILTVSEFTAAEITRFLGVPRHRMRVTLLAAEDFATDPAVANETLARLGIDGPFFLAVGAPDPRKNLPLLFAAMDQLYAAGAPAPLVVCGPGMELANLVRGLDAPWLKFAGFVCDAELAALYARTTALVFPSRYEGFGLPVLEAISLRTPVICARASSVPEVGGDAVLYFDPNDVTGLAKAMQRLLEEPRLREDLIVRMPAQVAKFSWRKCAEETLLGFDEAIAAAGGSGAR